MFERRKARIAKRLGLEEAQRPVTINVAPGATYVAAGAPQDLSSAMPSMPMAAAVDPVRQILHMQHQQMLLQQQWQQLQQQQAHAGAALAAQQQLEAQQRTAGDQNTALLQQQQAAMAAAAGTNTVTDQQQLLLQQQMWLQQQASQIPAPMPQFQSAQSSNSSDPMGLFHTLDTLVPPPQHNVPGQYLLPEGMMQSPPGQPGDGHL